MFNEEVLVYNTVKSILGYYPTSTLSCGTPGCYIVVHEGYYDPNQEHFSNNKMPPIYCSVKCAERGYYYNRGFKDGEDSIRRKLKKTLK